MQAALLDVEDFKTETDGDISDRLPVEWLLSLVDAGSDRIFNNSSAAHPQNTTAIALLIPLN
jgi:hypothetical protein